MDNDVIENNKNSNIKGAYIKEKISPTIISEGIIIKKTKR